VGRWAPHLGLDQREAIGDAVEEGRTTAEIIGMAAAGKLWYRKTRDRLDEFSVSETTVRKIAQERRRELPVAPGGGEVPLTLHEAASKTRKVALRTIARIEAIDNPSGRDLTDLRTAWGILGDIDRHNKGKQPAKRPRRNGKDAGSDLAQRLLAGERERP
jgi:hypothetical protein